MRFLKPIDKELLHEVGEKFRYVITVEDGAIIGGLGSAVMEFMNENAYHPRIMRLGIPDRFIDHGSQEELQKECGFDAQSIIDTVRAMIKPQVLSNAG
jgi:1-deoxy-D-xylulose-5-phosphate synthase